MIQKHVIFQDVSWWDNGPGCDCCPPSFVEAWNCLSHEELYWTCSSEIDCITEAIRLFDKEFNTDYKTDTEIHWKASSLGLTFSFIRGE